MTKIQPRFTVYCICKVYSCASCLFFFLTHPSPPRPPTPILLMLGRWDSKLASEVQSVVMFREEMLLLSFTPSILDFRRTTAAKKWRDWACPLCNISEQNHKKESKKKPHQTREWPSWICFALQSSMRPASISTLAYALLLFSSCFQQLHFFLKKKKRFIIACNFIGCSFDVCELYLVYGQKNMVSQQNYCFMGGA